MTFYNVAVLWVHILGAPDVIMATKVECINFMCQSRKMLGVHVLQRTSQFATVSRHVAHIIIRKPSNRGQDFFADGT